MGNNNEVKLIGRIKSVRETDFTTKKGEDMKSVRITLEVNDGRKSYPSIRIIGKSAENFLKHRQEGDKVLVKGVIETGSYEKDGETVYTTEVFASGWEFADDDARDLNRVTLIGGVCRDPYDSGKATRCTIAVEREKDGKCDYPRIVLFGDAMETFASTKGDKLFVCGRIQTGSYEKDGVKQYYTDVVVNSKEDVIPFREARRVPKAAPSDPAQEKPARKPVAKKEPKEEPSAPEISEPYEEFEEIDPDAFEW